MFWVLGNHRISWHVIQADCCVYRILAGGLRHRNVIAQLTLIIKRRYVTGLSYFGFEINVKL